MCNRVTVWGNKFSPFPTFAIWATIAYKFRNPTYSEFIVMMVERCRPLLQLIAKHGYCFEHVQSNRVHNTDLKHRRLLHGTRTVLAVNLRHSLKNSQNASTSFCDWFSSLSRVSLEWVGMYSSIWCANTVGSYIALRKLCKWTTS